MRRAQDRARSARSKRNGARSATIGPRAKRAMRMCPRSRQIFIFNILYFNSYYIYFCYRDFVVIKKSFQNLEQLIFTGLLSRFLKSIDVILIHKFFMAISSDFWQLFQNMNSNLATKT